MERFFSWRAPLLGQQFSEDARCGQRLYDLRQSLWSHATLIEEGESLDAAAEDRLIDSRIGGANLNRLHVFELRRANLIEVIGNLGPGGDGSCDIKSANRALEPRAVRCESGQRNGNRLVGCNAYRLLELLDQQAN